MLDLEIIPEKSISSEKWQLILGMSFYQVIQILKSNCETIKTIQLIYNDKDPMSSDYLLHLIQDGIILYFDSHNQRLKLIEITDLKKQRLRYYGNYFNSLPAVQPTFQQIIDIFGITSPGVYDNNSSVFLLHFPGLLFTFSIENYRVESKITHGIQSLQFPAGRAPLVSKISIYTGGKTPATAMAPEMPSLCLNKDMFATRLRVFHPKTNNKTNNGNVGGNGGITLSLFMQGTYRLEREMFDVNVGFGDSCQDVMSLIGTPNGVYYKSEDVNKNFSIGGNHSSSSEERLNTHGGVSNDEDYNKSIDSNSVDHHHHHSTSLSQLSPSRPNDYFYNYITLGVDVLFNSETNRVSKFVLHTNFPCHYNFNSYFMCNFELQMVNRETQQTCVITPATTLQQLQEWLPIRAQPAILHRSSSTNSVNPFGPTFFYVYEGTIFEIMTNGFIASVILCK